MNDNTERSVGARDRMSGCLYVATRTVTHRGVRIERGATRIAANHRWLREIPDAFAAVDSNAGKTAIRSESGWKL